MNEYNPRPYNGEELPSCMENAGVELRRRGGRGRVIFVLNEAHAYIITDEMRDDQNAINPPVAVTDGKTVYDINMDDLTKKQLLDLLEAEEAIDVTYIVLNDLG